MKNGLNFFVHRYSNALTYLFALFIFFILIQVDVYSQNMNSPRYGISVEKWKQNQTLIKFNQTGNSDNTQGFAFLSNGGFETGDFAGWVIQDVSSPFLPLQVNSAGIQPWFPFFSSDPTEGTLAALHGWDGESGTISLAQDITLPSTALTLEFDYRAAWDLSAYGATQDRNFIVSIEPTGGGSPLLIDTVLTADVGTINNDTGDLHGSIDVSAYANSSIRISFDWTVSEDFSGPGFFQLDNVFIKHTGLQIIVTENIVYGNVEVGTVSSPRTVNISNVGTSNCTVSGISDPGLPFTLSNVPSLPVVISPGESETFEVKFSPTSAGMLNGAITVSSDDSENPTQNVSLSGVGVIINPAAMGVCYASTGNNDGGRLLTIDVSTGAGTLVGSTGLGAIPGLAINSSGVIYAVAGANFDLYKIDASSGAAVFVANTGLAYLPAIAFDGNDVLYGLGVDTVTFTTNLYTINTTTGEPTVVGLAPMGDWRGMAFDPTDGTLWASTSGQEIYIIDPGTGVPTLIGSTGINGGIPDINFDDSGNLYGALGGSGLANDNFILINKTTSAGTTIGAIGFTSVSGLAARHQPLTGSQIGIIPGFVNFRTTEVGSSSLSRTVTIRSVGSTNLTVSGISDPGAPFSISNAPSLPVAISPGESETFDVIFSPTSAGVFNSSLTITSDDPDNATKDVSLSGEGVTINPAMSGVCYASTGNNDGGRLLTIDINTGAGTLIGPTGLAQVPGLAINSNGFIYGTSDDPDADLFKIDASTGTAAFIGSTGMGWMPAVAFDGNDVLYGLGTDFTTGFNLYIINTSTGDLTLVGPTNSAMDFRGMAFDPSDGTLWASTNGQEIFVINPNTGEPTLIGSTGLDGGVPDLYFDDMGNLYGAVGGGSSGNNKFISINKSTGEGTVIGSIGFTSVSGLAGRHQPLTGSQIGVIPGVVNFLNTEVGNSSPGNTVTIRSVGSENLTVSGISDPGSPFSLSNIPSLPVVITPGESETFEVTFSPTSEGDFNSSITFTSDDPDNPTKDVTVSGKGVIINPAISGVCYASTGYNDGGRLLTINVSTGHGTLIGSTGLDAVPGLAINSSGTIYAINDPGAGLYKIDALTGTTVFVGSTGLIWIPAIAFDENDVLYALGTDFSTPGFNLYTINTTSGVTTLVSPTNSALDFRGMAFDPTDGTLWASTNGQDIYVIDKNVGTPTLIGSTGKNGGVPDICFDDIGNLYGVVGGGQAGNIFFSINKTTGQGTSIGAVGLSFSSVSGLALTGITVSVDDNKTNSIPTVYDLFQNYPNPFNPSTLIKYNIPKAGHVTLKIYGILGNEIRTLVNGEKPAGSYNVEFNGSNLASGIYFYRLEAEDFVSVKKMILLK